MRWLGLWRSEEKPITSAGRQVRCTYCGSTNFFEGPSGGAAVNILCANDSCRHWFNYTVVGLEDLHRVEPTCEEKVAEQAVAADSASRERERRIEEGAIAFRSGLDIQSLRTDAPNSTYESASNVDRLVGYIRALAHRPQGKF